MRKRSSASWVILLSYFIAYLLAVVPFPEWALNYRPQWVAMVMIYWTMALPYRVGIGYAWMAGLMLDILEGSLLGLNALALAIIAYITLSLHQRLRMFSQLQQSGVVLALIGLHLMMTYWMKIAAGQSVASNMLFLLGALSSAFLWPWLFVLLRQLRRSFGVR
ncbi:MAG: rod shape-determining protein MreD [Pseudohongiellaceae bacterium]|nr:rod shape-determining protein MreD [Pseudohongiellaceae bacterium]